MKKIITLLFITLILPMEFAFSQIGNSDILGINKKSVKGTANGALYVKRDRNKNDYFILDFQAGKANAGMEDIALSVIGYTTSGKSMFSFSYFDSDGYSPYIIRLTKGNTYVYTGTDISYTIRKEKGREYWTFRFKKEVKFKNVNNVKDNLYVQPDSTIVFCFNK